MKREIGISLCALLCVMASGCGDAGNGSGAVSPLQPLAKSINVVVTIANCENYGSQSGNLRFMAVGSGPRYIYDYVDSANQQPATQTIYDIPNKLNVSPGTRVPTQFSLFAGNGADGYGYQYPSYYAWQSLTFEGLNYEPLASDGKSPIYVDSNNQLVRNMDPTTHEITNGPPCTTPSDIMPPCSTVGSGTYAHILAPQPNITSVDFSKNYGEATFDCANPAGGGSPKGQLAALIAKEVLKSSASKILNRLKILDEARSKSSSLSNERAPAGNATSVTKNVAI